LPRERFFQEKKIEFTGEQMIAAMEKDDWLARVRSWCTRHELGLFAIISSLFLVIIVKGSLSGAAHAQDYEIHLGSVKQALANPVNWLLFSYDRTNPPLYHLLAAGILAIWGEKSWLPPLGIFNGLLNYSALWVLYRLARLTIGDIYYRLSLYLVVAFLPVFVITSTAFASDCATTLPTLLFVWLMAATAAKKSEFFFGVLLVSLTLGLLVSIKFVAIPLILAAFISCLGCALLQIVSVQQAIVGGCLAVLFPGLLALHWLTLSPDDVSVHFSPDIGEQRGRMDLRSLVFFRAGDVQLLKAPDLYPELYNVKSTHGLFQANYFSYPGLMIYGSFTDYLDIYHRSGKKNHAERTLARVSLRIGLVASIAGALILLFGGMFSLFSFLQKPTVTTFVSLVCLLSGGAYFGFIIAILPFTTMSYAFGYWDPRLVVAGIVCLCIAAFSFLDRLPFHWRSRLGLPIVVFCGLGASVWAMSLIR
jgi:hypothetical protein